MNGVCVRFRGWVDLERLDGVGCLEYDERRGAHEDAVLKEQLERYNQRLKEFEDSKRNVYPRVDDVRRNNGQSMNALGSMGAGGGIWRR
jgi:hypothetical protein